MRRPGFSLVGLIAAASLALSATSCEETTCGPGTVEQGGECVPLQPANCTGEGVVFEQGRCVPNYDTICGPGTELNDAGQCVSVGGVPDPTPDMGRDITEDTGLDLAGDAPADGVADGADLAADIEDEETGGFVPQCAGDLDPDGDPATICIWGQLSDFITLQPVPDDADPPLQVQVKDLLEAQLNPADSLAETMVLDGGYFIFESVELVGPTRPIILIVGEDEDITPPDIEGVGAVYQRTISGLIEPDGVESTYGETALGIILRSAVTGWNTELSLTGGDVLEATGFFVGRVLDALSGAPIMGAEFVCGNCGGTPDIWYFQDIAMTTIGGSTTGPSGAVLFRGGDTADQCNATATNFTQLSDISCGTFPGRASLGIVGLLGQ